MASYREDEKSRRARQQNEAMPVDGANSEDRGTIIDFRKLGSPLVT